MVMADPSDLGHGKKNLIKCIQCKSTETMMEELLMKQSQALEDEVNEIKKTGAGRIARVFKLKLKIVGNQKVGQEPTAIRDPETGDLLVSSKDIKITTRYCVKNLENKQIEEPVKAVVVLKEMLHNMKMKEDKQDEFEVNIEEYEEVLERFKGKSTYNFLTRAGEKYQEAMRNLVQRQIKEEIILNDFRKTHLQMIRKGKRLAEILKNSRFLHMKPFLPRACEAVIVGRMTEKILQAGSIYQIGGQPGHSTEESIFVIKIIIARAQSSGKGFLFSLVDIVAFFDKEQILDVIDCLDRVGVSRKAAKCWFELKEKTQIRVKTAAGMKRAAKAGTWWVRPQPAQPGQRPAAVFCQL